MNISCPHCGSRFLIDADRIPGNGVKTRCSNCSGTFVLGRQGVAASAPSRAAAEIAHGELVSNSTQARAEAASATTQPRAAAATSFSEALHTPASVAARSELPTSTSSAEFGAAGGTAPKRRSFREQDAGARAQRIARALVSDIVAYHREKLEQTLSAGTLRTEFREEIRKSWEEYVEQVGLDIAKTTPYFRDALNEILAKGDKVF